MMNLILLILVLALILISLLYFFKVKKLTQKLDLLEKKSSFSEVARDYLLRSVNHELRAPMARMGVDIEMINDKSIANSLSKDLGLMTEMIDELMDIEKIKHNSLQEKMDEKISLKDLVNEVSIDLGVDTASLSLSVDEGSEYLLGSSFQLKKLFKNLIENAFKYRGESGLVRVDIKDIHHKKVVTILNEGAYISSEELPFLFEPFFRRQQDQVNKKGFGLGLYLCKEVIDAHQGTIKVSSKRGQGTMVKLTFESPQL